MTLHISFLVSSNNLEREREMEMGSVKSEVGNPGRRKLCMVDGENNVENNKCVKRRRRDTIASALSCSIEQKGKQQQQQQQQNVVLPQADQSVVVAATKTTTTTTVKRSSKFRGVSRHRWTGRYEAHLWDKGSWNATQRKKGKQVYLGAYDEEESAARAYDLAAIKYWGTSTFTNFPASDYEKETEIMQNVTREEYLAFLRRKSSGFSRGVSKYRGVARHHHNGRWEARIGRVFGNKYLYLGTYSTQEEAAHAYDIAAIEYRGINAVTNFDLSTYIRWLRTSSPGATNSLAIKESRPSLLAIESPSSSKQKISDQRTASEEEPELLLPLPFHINPFEIDDLGTPKKQEIYPKKFLPISPSNNSSSTSPSSLTSSPTALGLLFRSSVFRELVEKNSNAANHENHHHLDGADDDDTKNKSQIGEENRFERLFYDEVGDGLPYVCSLDGGDDALPVMAGVLQQEGGLPSSSYNNETGKSFWNGKFNMPLLPSINTNNAASHL